MENPNQTPGQTELQTITSTDARALRNLMGQFATGVTVITTQGADGTPIGLTANSFSSVSLDPALVLWSLDRRSPNLEVFKHVSHFAINILAADQHQLSNQFARPADDKFEGVEFLTCDSGTVVIDGALVTLVCRNYRQYDGGDHIIFIGEIEQFTQADGVPLVFHSGKYQALSPHPTYA